MDNGAIERALSADVFVRTFLWQLRRRSRMSQLVLGIMMKKWSKQRIEENKNVAQEEASLIYFNKIRYNRKNSDEYSSSRGFTSTNKVDSACAVMLTIFSPLHNARFKREWIPSTEQCFWKSTQEIDHATCQWLLAVQLSSNWQKRDPAHSYIWWFGTRVRWNHKLNRCSRLIDTPSINEENAWKEEGGETRNSFEKEQSNDSNFLRKYRETAGEYDTRVQILFYRCIYIHSPWGFLWSGRRNGGRGRAIAEMRDSETKASLEEKRGREWEKG